MNTEQPIIVGLDIGTTKIAVIAGRKGGELAPLAITGTRLHGIEYSSPVASAQIKSALLFAGLFAEGTMRFREPRLSRDHTERMFQSFGIPLRQEAGALQALRREEQGERVVSHRE